ncbi:hypothetical protein ACO2Q3_22605 [Caulobacter sp. KR2-114]|uniref:hypothetical protein n=1 Tax=Caulobacter sp. KR2-114 TaxID=3400912 RepID=UPI003C069ABF
MSTVAQKVMLAAWKLQRADGGRSFSDCLVSAWRIARSSPPAARLARQLARGGAVSLRSTVTTPAGRAAASSRYVRNADWQAAGLTGRLSW